MAMNRCLINVALALGSCGLLLLAPLMPGVTALAQSRRQQPHPGHEQGSGHEHGVSETAATFPGVGEYVPVFGLPERLTGFVNGLNGDILAEEETQKWGKEWVPNWDENVHITINDSYLNVEKQDLPNITNPGTVVGTHNFKDPGAQMTLDNTITRINKNPPKSLPTLECMLWKAKSNHLDFKQMSLGDHEENGVLFLKLDFNDQSDDSKSLNKITNQSLTAKSPWHITVGHFNNVNNAKRERLKRFKEKLRPRLKCMDTCVGNVQLETVRIVHTDNAKAQYSLYNKPYQPPTSPPTGCQ